MDRRIRWAGEPPVYGVLWRSLPGPLWLRLLLLLVLFAAVVAVLFIYVFPQVAPMMPFNDNTVD